MSRFARPRGGSAEEIGDRAAAVLVDVGYEPNRGDDRQHPDGQVDQEHPLPGHGNQESALDVVVRTGSGQYRWMEFRTVLLLARKTATGLEVPPEVVEALGSGRKPAVTVTLNGDHTYRSTVASMGGRYLVPVSAEHRVAAGVQAGDEVLVDLVLDTVARELVLPEDLVDALHDKPAARVAFDALSYSNRRRHVMAVEGAKAAATRARRVSKVVTDLLA